MFRGGDISGFNVPILPCILYKLTDFNQLKSLLHSKWWHTFKNCLSRDTQMHNLKDIDKVTLLCQTSPRPCSLSTRAQLPKWYCSNVKDYTNVRQLPDIYKLKWMLSLISIIWLKLLSSNILRKPVETVLVRS
jgi:hypothetical protein